MSNVNEFGQFLDSLIWIYENGDKKGTQRNIFYNYYNKYMKNDDSFYKELYQMIGEKNETYTLVISIIYEVTKDVRCMMAILDMLLTRDVDEFFADNILYQLGVIAFTTPEVKLDYETKREINKKLLEAHLKKYPIPYSYTPYKERNHKRIVVETNMLLSLKHAPTINVLNLCRYLQEEQGYEVYLVVNRSDVRSDIIGRYWYPPVLANYNPDIEGEFCLDYEGAMIRGFQYVWDENCIESRNAVLELIDRWKPLCVYYAGMDSYRHDIYRNMTTLISMPFNGGYISSEAQYLMCYMGADSEIAKAQLNYINKEGQIPKQVSDFGIIAEESVNSYSKVDFDMPEDAFAICIVGNRIDQEMTPEFVEILEEVARKREKVYYVFVGPSQQNHFSDEVNQRVRKLGFRNDLTDTLRAMDLFVNPVRLGGGGGGSFALQARVPVVTLENCDVYAVVGEEFGCKSLEDMKETIFKYIDNEQYYNHQMKAVEAWNARKNAVNRWEEVYKVIMQIKDELRLNG